MELILRFSLKESVTVHDVIETLVNNKLINNCLEDPTAILSNIPNLVNHFKGQSVISRFDHYHRKQVPWHNNMDRIMIFFMTFVHADLTKIAQGIKKCIENMVTDAKIHYVNDEFSENDYMITYSKP